MTNIIRLDTSSMGEISHLASDWEHVHWLYARRLQPTPYRKVNIKTNEVSDTFMPPYPITTWYYVKHGNKIVFVGQAYTEGWDTGDPCNPSSIAVSIVIDNGVISFHKIPHTDNVNELVGICYHNGEFKAGERSGFIAHEDPNYYRKCADHKDGGGIWISPLGKNWRWSGFKDPYIDNGLIQYGREVYLATLNGKLYAFLHGGQVPETVKTSVYEVHNDYSVTHIVDTPDPNIGLVPFPINPDENNRFSWKGAIIMWNSYPALAVFNPSLSPPLQFWNITVDGTPINSAGAVPVGVYNDKLLIATTISGDKYTICQASELFGSVTRLADNWMTGHFTKGIIANNKLWIGVQGAGSSAVDMLSLDGVSPPPPPPPPEKHTLTLVVKYTGEPIKDAEVEVVYG